jgi:hypothetical protein
MGFIEDTLAAPRPDALAALDLPRRQQYHPSPGAVRLVANPGRRGGTLHSQPERADGSRCGTQSAGFCLHRDHELGGGQRGSRG